MQSERARQTKKKQTQNTKQKFTILRNSSSHDGIIRSACALASEHTDNRAGGHVECLIDDRRRVAAHVKSRDYDSK